MSTWRLRSDPTRSWHHILSNLPRETGFESDPGSVKDSLELMDEPAKGVDGLCSDYQSRQMELLAVPQHLLRQLMDRLLVSVRAVARLGVSEVPDPFCSLSGLNGVLAFRADQASFDLLRRYELAVREVLCEG